MCPRRSSPLHRPLTALVGLAALAGLAGCMGDANPVRDQLNAAGIGPKAVTAPDFVAQSRPRELDYVPVGTAAQDRPRAKSAAEVKTLEAELEAARGRNAARGGVKAGQPKKTKAQD